MTVHQSAVLPRRPGDAAVGVAGPAGWDGAEIPQPWLCRGIHTKLTQH